MRPLLTSDRVLRRTNKSPRHFATPLRQPNIRSDLLPLTTHDGTGDPLLARFIRGTASPSVGFASSSIEAQIPSPARSNPAARRTISTFAELPKNIRGVGFQPATAH